MVSRRIARNPSRTSNWKHPILNNVRRGQLVLPPALLISDNQCSSWILTCRVSCTNGTPIRTVSKATTIGYHRP